ncbi:MAG: hypothetical protein NZM37_07700 [Sandaracinaceae bacterium]|nr:hypothetical protein [Sandaracinaceae bacterium]
MESGVGVARFRGRLGDLLLASLFLRESELNHALEEQKRSGKRLGEVLLELGYISELELAHALAHQLGIPWVNLKRATLSEKVLNLIPGSLAKEARAIPIEKRFSPHREVLLVATDDPLNEKALQAIANEVGCLVQPVVARKGDLEEALALYYGSDSEEGEAIFVGSEEAPIPQGRASNQAQAYSAEVLGQGLVEQPSQKEKEGGSITEERSDEGEKTLAGEWVEQTTGEAVKSSFGFEGWELLEARDWALVLLKLLVRKGILTEAEIQEEARRFLAAPKDSKGPSGGYPR